MLHEPAARSGKDPATSFKTRIGIYMFVVYALIYAGFVAINVAKPLAMERTVFAGQNLAVTYGLGLIVFALLLAVVYNHLCTRRELRLGAPQQERRQ